MESLIIFLGIATSGGMITTAIDNMFDSSFSSIILIVALCFLGTNLVSNLTERNSPLEYVTAFSSLFIGALLANSLIAVIELPVNSDLAQTAISANLGMTVSGLLILAVYGREGFLNK